ncbi:MAG: KamA family radical SAM protein [Deltaproteobacteria bacterium]|nr:KamA family radical SAM protein [Deltaproteobacteria bacterium]
MQDPRPLPSLPPASAHRELLDGAWWQAAVPSWAHLGPEAFLEPSWQARNTVTTAQALLDLVGGVVPRSFASDLRRGLRQAPMGLRVPPFLLGLVDWRHPQRDPIRRQFVPLGSEGEEDHPLAAPDVLAEQRDTVAPGLVHRYPSKVLFLALDACPLHCRCCTRSYAVGADTPALARSLRVSTDPARWEPALAWVAQHEEIEDFTLSGGDPLLLPPSRIAGICERLLAIGHIRRVRISTRLLSACPMAFLPGRPWPRTLSRLAAMGRRRGVQVSLQVHVGHAREITALTARAVATLVGGGVVVRAQTVLQRGVNDDPVALVLLLRRLAWVGVQPACVYLHDLVPGVETLRTTLDAACEIERFVRGTLSGFDMPAFVVDLPGGGGKRDVHSSDTYDRRTGLAVFRSPAVAPGRRFLFADPLRDLEPSVQAAWRDPAARRRMLEAAGLA